MWKQGRSVHEKRKLNFFLVADDHKPATFGLSA